MLNVEGLTSGAIRRLRRRNRAILCRYGVGPGAADAVFDLELAGWSSRRIAALLEKLVDLLSAGWTAAEIEALMDGTSA